MGRDELLMLVGIQNELLFTELQTSDGAKLLEIISSIVALLAKIMEKG